MIRYHVAVLMVLCMTTALWGQDVIRLKTGATLAGTIVEQDELTVTLQFEGGSIRLLRDQIANVDAKADKETVAKKKAIMTLSRFAAEDSWHFLYRDGRRVGYRTLSLRRESIEGIPGYVIRDRLVFMSSPGAMADVDVQVSEWVDAELRPLHFLCTLASGESARSTEGKRSGHTMNILSNSAGRREESTAFIRNRTEFPRMLLRRLASEPPPEGGYPEFRVFHPRDLTVSRVTLQRRLERMNLRGRQRDVLVFRQVSKPKPLETWLDMGGRVLREEIGSPRLVSLRAPQSDVQAWIRGENVPDGDLALEFVSEPTGFRMLRPDLSWELMSSKKAGFVASMARPGLRATIDVLRIPHADANSTEEGVAMKVLSRMGRNSKYLDIDGPRTATIGDQKGLRFTATCKRKSAEIKTLGAVIMNEGQAFVILCAAPKLHFTQAYPAFLETLDSVRLLNPDTDRQPDPFEKAEAQTGEKIK